MKKMMALLTLLFWPTSIVQAQEQSDIDNWDFVYGDYHTNVTETAAWSGYGTTDTLWLWDGFYEDYYLAEYVSPTGEAAREMEVGDYVYLYGEKYRVKHIKRNLSNEPNAAHTTRAKAAEIANNSDFTIQTCEDNKRMSQVRIIAFEKVSPRPDSAVGVFAPSIFITR